MTNIWRNHETFFCNFREVISKDVIDKWQTDWDLSDVGLILYLILNKVSKDFLCTRQVLLYFLTGHGSFPSFRFEIGKKGTVTSALVDHVEQWFIILLASVL